jgi:preprotein translocase subunit SecE
VLGVRIPPGLPASSAAKREVLMEFDFRSTFEGTKQFLREVKTELKKVTWPSRKDTLTATAVVLVTVFVAAVFLGVVDSGLSNLFKVLLRKAG